MRATPHIDRTTDHYGKSLQWKLPIQWTVLHLIYNWANTLESPKLFDLVATGRK